MGRLSFRRIGNQIELSWTTVPEATYDLIYSDNFTDWATLSTHQGTGDIVHVALPVDKTRAHRVFRLIVHVPENTEVIGWAVTAWDGSYVFLEWEPIGRGSYDVFRNGQLISNTGNTHYRDTQISSGASYSYTVRFRP